MCRLYPSQGCRTMRPTRSEPLSSMQRQDRMDGHPDAPLLKQLRHDSLVVSRRATDAVHVELLAHHVDDPQRNRAWGTAFPACRTHKGERLSSSVTCRTPPSENWRS